MEFTVEKKGIQRIFAFNKGYLIHYFVSFMLGRVFIMGAISPFALCYLSAFMNTKTRTPLKVVLTVAFALAGTLTTQYSGTVLKYLLAYVLYGLLYISVSTVWGNYEKYIQYPASVAAVGISGIIYYAQLGNIWDTVWLTFLECVICFMLPFVIKSSACIICDGGVLEDVDTIDIMGVFALGVIVTAGLCGLNVGGIALGKVVCGAVIMIIAYGGGCTWAVTWGVGAGILFSLYSFEYNEYVGILGFCGLVTGIASQYKRQGIILAFIVSTRLLSIYFGGWSGAVFSYLEAIISICIFCLVPSWMLFRIRAYFNRALNKNKEFKKYRDMVNHKLKFASDALESLGGVCERAFGEIPPNINDISTIYDITAGKVCKSCGLKFVCWDKEAFDTRDILNKTLSGLMEEGQLTNENIPVEFKKRCVKYVSFASEMNRIYFKLKENNHWQERADQSKKIIASQLNGVSGIMKDISDDINKNIIFDNLEESKIMHILEQSGIKPRDVTVVHNFTGKTSVTVVVKGREKDGTDIQRKTELAVKDTLNKNIVMEECSFNKNSFTVKFKEAQKYNIETSYISIPKKGQQICGDSIVEGSLPGGKFAVILSDGMGCGKTAGEQSVTATELMQQFLKAGFDKKIAVDMINSALMLKCSETFATIDAVIIDLFTADAEFIKAGANTTYIKSEGIIKKISSHSLPVGIINNTKAQTNQCKVKNGDIIILISDGIHNATDNWIEKFILKINSDDPKEIAGLLTGESKKRKNMDDDMTVAVLKITENKEDIYA